MLTPSQLQRQNQERKKAFHEIIKLIQDNANVLFFDEAVFSNPVSDMKVWFKSGADLP